MKRFQTQDDLGDVVPRPLFRKRPKRFDESGTVTTIKILHYEIKVLLALEGKVKLCNERRFRLFHKNHSLRFHVRDLVFRDHVCLLEHFDSKVVARDLLLREEDRAKGTFADRLDDLEILDRRGRCS